MQTTYIQATGNRSVRLHPTSQLLEQLLPTIDDGVDEGLTEEHAKLSNLRTLNDMND